MSTAPKLLSVIAPCFNEAQGIRAFHEELKRVLEPLDLEHEILFVDDGSTDSTLLILNELAREDPRVDVLSFTRNFGHQAALSAGLDHARGAAVVMLDSDLQHPPALIPEMVKRWEAGDEVVSAVRETTEAIPFHKRWASKLFYWLLNRLSETHVEPNVADFCLLSRRACDFLTSLPERNRFLRGLIAWSGMRRSFLTFHAPPRHAGKTKYSYAKMFAVAIDAFFSFTIAPIRFVIRAGLFVVALGLVYLFYVLYRYAFHDDLVRGWASIVCVLLVLGGLQILSIGVVGGYVGRLFEDSKHRPRYVLKQERSQP